MKSIFRKIAFVLALAMVVTLFPVMSASAAVKDNKYVRTKNATLFVGGDANGNYESCWATGKKAKALVKEDGYKSAYTTDDKDGKIVSVSKYGEVTAVGIGKATVTATFTKKGEKDIVESFDVNVKKNAVNVAFEEELQKKLTEGLTVGDKITFKAVQTSADGENDVTDAAKFTVTDSEGEVKKFNENDEYEAVKAGKITVTVKSWQWAWDWKEEKNVSTPTTEEVSIEVEVKEALPTVKNARLQSVTKIVFDAVNVTKEDLKNFKITDQNKAPLNVLFKEPVLSEDGKTLTLEKHSEMTNGEKLYFAFGDGEPTELVVKYGKLAAIRIDNSMATVEVGKETKLKYTFVDAEGIELSIPTNGVRFTIDDTSFAYLNNDVLTMWQVGKTVKVQVIYDTGEFKADWTPIEVKSDVFAIRCVEKAAVQAKGISFKLNIGGKDQSDYTTETMSMYMNSNNPKLIAQVKLSDDGKLESKDSAGFSFETLTPSIILVNATTGELFPVSVGEAKILVKYNDGVSANISLVATVQVRANQALRSVSADKASVMVSNNTEVQESAVFYLTGHDQYGNDLDMKNFTPTEIKQINGPTNKTTNKMDEMTLTKSGSKLQADPKTHTAGSYTYRITFENNVSIVVSITVKEPITNDLEKAASYKIVSVNGNVNVDTENFNGNADYKFKIVAVDSTGTAFAVVKDLNTKYISEKYKYALAIKFGNDAYKDINNTEIGDLNCNSDGIYTVSFVVSQSAITASGPAITDVAKSGKNVVKNGTSYQVKEGDFIISGMYNGRTILPLAGNVSIKKSVPTINVKATEVVAYGPDEALKTAIKEILEVDKNKYEILDIELRTTSVGTGRQYVLLKKVIVSEKRDDGGYIIHTVDMHDQYLTVIVK